MSEHMPANEHATAARNWLGHAEDAVLIEKEAYVGMAQAEAMLALAYEQRTANLIAHQRNNQQAGGRFQDSFNPDIEARLGIPE